MTSALKARDHELKVAVSDELSWTPNVNTDRIGVAVTDGAVTLSGEVENYPEKRAAVRAAQRVRGVIAVADEIVVKHLGGLREDPDIARDAAEAISRNVRIPAGSVKVAVHDHVVTLTGTVLWQYQRNAAHDAVAYVPGVKGVNNLLTLKPHASVRPAEAKAKITAALLRQAQIDAKHINVNVSDNKVILSGQVSSWAELRQAEHAAWSLPGVTYVENHLTISYQPSSLDHGVGGLTGGDS